MSLTRLHTEPSLIDQVHEQLVMAISTGSLPAGQRLTQESIAELLGVSRQPVSHALQLLKHQGLLIEHGRRGLAVTPVDGEKIRQLYQIREALDGLAARLAAQRISLGQASEDDISTFQTALQRGESLTAEAEIIERVQADVAFHQALYTLSGNREISRTVAEQWPQFMRSMAVVLDSADHSQTIWSEHQDIANAVCAGEVRSAEDLACQHAYRAGETTARRLEATEKQHADKTQSA